MSTFTTQWHVVGSYGKQRGVVNVVRPPGVAELLGLHISHNSYLVSLTELQKKFSAEAVQSC